jgi:hypothetical protein
MTFTQKEVQNQIYEICNEIAEFLVEKNNKYGNSVLEPVRIFSKSSIEEQVAVRMDDKLSRIANRQDNEDEDPYADLIGYLILDQVRRRLENRADKQWRTKWPKLLRKLKNTN